MRLKTFALTAIALAFSTASHAALITNGGFETGNFNGWTLTGKVDLTRYESVCANGATFGSTTCTAQSGNWAAALGPDGPAVDLFQNVSTTAGTDYSLTFYLRNENLGKTPNNSFDVRFGGTSLYTFTNTANFGLTQFTIGNLLATTGTTRLDFVVENVPGGFFLDDVSLAAVPEPACAFLVAGSLGAFALLRRRGRA
jgi:hypothetical protein